MISAINGISTADEKPYIDKWGSFISGEAPIYDANGNVVAIFGVDRLASDLNALTFKTFAPLYYFLAFFLLFVVLRFAAMHHSVFRDAWNLVIVKIFCLGLAICCFAAFLLRAYLKTPINFA
jgi:hypothetical protein